MKKKKINKLLLMFISFLTSLILWFYVTSSLNLKMEIVKKISIKLPESLSRTNIIDNDIYIEIQGPRLLLSRLKNIEEEIVIRPDVNDLKSNELSVQIKNSDLDLPLGIEVLSVTPRIMKLNVDKKIKRKLTIQPLFETQISSGFELVDYSISPKVTMVSGPSSLLKKMKTIDTELVDLGQYIGKGEDEIRLEVLDSRFEMSQSSVDFKYEIKASKSNVVLRDLSIVVKSKHLVKKMDQNQANIFLLMDEKLKDKVDPSEIEVLAIVPDDATGEIEVPLKVRLPNTMHLIEIIPKTIKISL